MYEITSIISLLVSGDDCYPQISAGVPATPDLKNIKPGFTASHSNSLGSHIIKCNQLGL